MKFTPRGLRRTFNDLARAAKVETLVTKSISGHITDRMREHYSTVQPVDQRESIGWVLCLVKGTSAIPDTNEVVLRVVLRTPKWCSQRREVGPNRPNFL
jgi:hypothetical protein